MHLYVYLLPVLTLELRTLQRILFTPVTATTEIEERYCGTGMLRCECRRPSVQQQWTDADDDENFPSGNVFRLTGSTVHRQALGVDFTNVN